jgi:hypothetical protein
LESRRTLFLSARSKTTLTGGAVFDWRNRYISITRKNFVDQKGFVVISCAVQRRYIVMTEAVMRELIEKAKVEAVREAQAATADALSALRTTLVKEIGEAVGSKLLGTQITVTTELATAQRESLMAKWLPQIVPTVLVAVLGFLSLYLQLGITRKIEQENQQLSSKLLLGVEYYKQRMAVYDQFFSDLDRLLSAAINFQLAPEEAHREKELLSLLVQLDSSRKSNQFYISREVADALGKAWRAGTKVENGTELAERVNKLHSSISVAQQEMLKEVPFTQELLGGAE